MTERKEVVVHNKRYRVTTRDGTITCIESVNPTHGEKTTYRVVDLNGRAAAAVRRQLTREPEGA